MPHWETGGVESPPSGRRDVGRIYTRTLAQQTFLLQGLLKADRLSRHQEASQERTAAATGASGGLDQRQ